LASNRVPQPNTMAQAPYKAIFVAVGEGSSGLLDASV
jgi:hypothetical protein